MSDGISTSSYYLFLVQHLGTKLTAASAVHVNRIFPLATAGIFPVLRATTAKKDSSCGRVIATRPWEATNGFLDVGRLARAVAMPIVLSQHNR